MRTSTFLSTSLLLGLGGLVACGGASDPADVDAAAGEPDAELPPDALVPQPVTMTVYDGSGGPDPGVHVLFYEPDGTFVADVTTGADGTATETIAPGGSVLVIVPPTPPLGGGSSGGVIAHLGVAAGASLAFGRPAVTPPATVSFTVTAPTRATATSYALTLDCDAGLTSVAPTFAFTNQACGGARQGYVHAYNGTTLLGTLYDAQVTITGGGMIALDGTYDDPVASTYTVTGMPASTMSANVAMGVSTPAFQFLSPSVSSGGTPSGGTLSAMGPLPGVAGAGLVTQTGVNRAGFGANYFFGRRPAAASVTDDASDHLLGYISTPVFDSEARRAQWTELGGRLPNSLIAILQGSRPGVSYTWYVLAPYAGPAWVLPELPAAHAAVEIEPADDVALAATYFAELATVRQAAVLGNLATLFTGGFAAFLPDVVGETSALQLVSGGG